jgi:hypothetical protein
MRNYVNGLTLSTKSKRVTKLVVLVLKKLRGFSPQANYTDR